MNDYIYRIELSEEQLVINGTPTTLYKVWGAELGTMHFTSESAAENYVRLLYAKKEETGNAWHFDLYGKPIAQLADSLNNGNQHTITELKCNGKKYYRIGKFGQIKYFDSYYEAEREIRMMTGYYGCDEYRKDKVWYTYDRTGKKEQR